MGGYKGGDLEDLANILFGQLKQRMDGYMNLPESSRPEESALGQLEILMKSSQKVASEGLYVVHRLDCEVRLLPCHCLEAILGTYSI